MKSPFIASLLALTMTSALVGCSASGGMEGTTTQRTAGKTSSKSTGTTYSSSGDSTNAGSSKDTNSSDGSLPGTQDKGTNGSGMIMATSDDTVSPPDNITGTFLFCFEDSIDGASADVLCAIEDKVTKKPIPLTSTYTAHQWTSQQPSALTVTSKEQPANAYWQVQFTVKAATKDTLTAGLAAVKFLFDGTKIDNTKDDFNINVTTQARPNLLIKSLKPQVDSIFRCMDYFRMKGDKIVTTPCGVQTSAQDWFLTAGGKISHVSGVCMKFNPVSKLAIEGDCAAGDTPVFEVVGSQLRIKSSTTCVALLNADNSGVDYVGSAACNTGDNTQNWSVNF